jgi:predicted HNH restriction endonuclease
MSISKKWTADAENVRQVLNLYRSTDAPTVEQIAQSLSTTCHNVLHVLKTHTSIAEYKALQAIRYSRSKMGSKNPMKGKTMEQHHNFIGEVFDGHGYLTCLKDGKRQFVHRVVFAQALGLSDLPEELDVHHIDGDKTNNLLNNLALVTSVGHKMIHYLQMKDSLSVALKKSKLRDALKFMTSQ